MLVRFLTLLLLPLLWFSPVWAQVAVPSIDPAEPVLVPAASSWRMGTSVGGGSHYGSQKTTQEKVANHEFGSYGLIVFQPTHVTTEIYATENDNQAQWDSTSDILYEYQHKEQRVNLAVRGEGRVSVGLGVLSRTWDSRGIERNHRGFGGSFGVRIGDGMYLAAGMNRVTEKIDSYEDKQWNETLGGLGFAYGDPDSSMFRLEGSMFTRPEVNKGETRADINPKQVQQIGDLEILLSRYLFSAKSTVTKTSAGVSGEADQELRQMRYGIGYRRLNFSWVLYRIQGTEAQGDKKHEQSYYKMTMGVGFL